jgi:hypothetical protein
MHLICLSQRRLVIAFAAAFDPSLGKQRSDQRDGDGRDVSATEHLTSR